MAPPKLTDYENKRLENIHRNNEMMAALKLQSKASQLGTKVKRKFTKRKPKTETPIPIVIRSSLRTRGITPDSNGLTHKITRKTLVDLDPIPMKDAYRGIHDSDRSFIESLVAVSNKEELNGSVKKKKKKKKIESSLDLESISLNPENIVRFFPSRLGRISQVQFLPSNDVKMVVAGCRAGVIGIWNVAQSEVFLYHPHQALISGISVHPNCLSKIYTSCKDGFVRMMDVEKEIFEMVYNTSGDDCISALSQPNNDANCLYIAEGSGRLTVWDNRIGKCLSPSHFSLHRLRINTIDFNPENPHIAVTSSTDGTACTWDFRCTGNLTALKTFTYERALQSAYFSPSGRSIGITSLDSTISIHSGVNMEDAAFVNHESARMLSTYRAIWGWDDSYLFIGSNKRVEIVSTAQKATVKTLEIPLRSSVPHIFDAHPYEVGMLAGGTNGGEVYVWTSSQDF